MIELNILKKDNYVYELQDSTGKKYTLNLEFLDTDINPKEGDTLIFKSKLLNPTYGGYSLAYTFGNLDSKYGKANISLDDVDVIKVIHDNKENYLKRIYG